MDQYKKTFEAWNNAASLYQEKFMDLDLYNESYDFICNAITKHKPEILEIGCGPGNITRYLLSKRPDFNIYGIDAAPNMIALAVQNNPAANFNVMDARQINKLQTTFDGIICGFCLPYLSQEDGKKLIVNSFNLLTESGLIYLSFIEGDPGKSGYQVGSSGDSVYFYYHNPDQLKRQLADNGFELLKMFRVDYKRSATEKDIHIIVIAEKKEVI